MPPDFADELVRLLPALRRYGLSLAGRPDLADDLAQITVERALSRAEGYDRAQPLRPWLFRILRNAWIDMTRRQKVRGPTVDVTDAPEILPHDPGRALEARLMLDAVRAAMATLPVEQREVIHLVCVEDLSYAEAADALGIPRGTVMSRLSRGRAALAEKLGMI